MPAPAGKDRDQDRDISERIALGQSAPTMSQESFYDQRLFNQSSGLNTGLANVDEDGDGAVAAYDKVGRVP